MSWSEWLLFEVRESLYATRARSSVALGWDESKTGQPPVPQLNLRNLVLVKVGPKQDHPSEKVKDVFLTGELVAFGALLFSLEIYTFGPDSLCERPEKEEESNGYKVG